MNAVSSMRFPLLLLALFCASTLGIADGLNNNEVQFTGVVKSIAVNGQGAGTLFVSLDTIDLRIIVNAKTIIQGPANEIMTLEGLAGLSDSSDPETGLMVEITGKFSSSGILAGRVRVVETASDFDIRGHITRIQFPSPNQALISLLGITILADLGSDPPVTIQMNGVDVPISDLKIGTKIEVVGSILDDGTWSAGQIKVFSAARKKGLVFFEGKIQAYDSGAGFIDVAVSGATGNVTRVLISPETTIQGTLAPDVYVLIIGTINADYSFTAKGIRVLAALEIKPDERKLAITQSATFTVKLRERPSSEVLVTLTVDKSGILEPFSPTTLSIPAGELTADFRVTGLAAGMAIITAAALGDQATATVVVGQLTEDDGERPSGQARISFSPDHIKMEPNETREVVLHIQPPQKTDIALEWTSSDETIVPIPTTRVLSNGAAMFKVAIQSTGNAGKASIIAKLPETLGGGMAELVVEVEAKKGK